MGINVLLREGVGMFFLYHNGNGMGIGIQSWEWKGMGSKKPFLYISNMYSYLCRPTQLLSGLDERV